MRAGFLAFASSALISVCGIGFAIWSNLDNASVREELDKDRAELAAALQNLREGQYSQAMSCRNLGEPDPLCGQTRALTHGEKRILSQFFGPQLPVDDIRIRYFNNTLDLGYVFHAVAPNVIHINTMLPSSGAAHPLKDLQNIDGSNPGLAGTLFHEAAHIMQNLGHLPMSGRADAADPNRYEYAVADDQNFGQFTNEQGASIVADAVTAMFANRSFRSYSESCEAMYSSMSPEWVISCQGRFEDTAPAMRMVLRQFGGAAGLAPGFTRSIANVKQGIPSRTQITDNSLRPYAGPVHGR